MIFILVKVPYHKSDQRPKSYSDDEVINNSLPACPYLWTNLLDEFLFGRELELLSQRLHAHLIHILHLGHSQFG